ncbi:YSIRK-type signal peptide-containing protein [Staphylococcus caprae]|uniref:YSIRK-type signal peptide-containing protein n=1 Tax=Staphylococcus caprae TaxID=29380 RepID=UPI0033937ADA
MPNRHNKYSIRRFTVGTASILVGATIIFGVDHEAKAAEHSTDTASLTSNNEEASNSSPVGQLGDTQKKTHTTQNNHNVQQLDNQSDEVGTSLKAQNNDVQSAEKTSTETSKEVMQNHTRNAKDLSGDAQSTDNTTEKQQEVKNNNSNQETLTTNNQTTKNTHKVSRDEDVEQANKQSTNHNAKETEHTVQTTKAQNPELQASAKQNSQSQTSQTSKRVSPQEQVTETYSPQDSASTRNQSTQKSVNKVNGLNNSNTRHHSLSNSPIDDQANEKNAIQVQATPRTVSRFAQPVSRAATNEANSEQQGSNVNDKINVDSFNVSKKSFDPNHSGYSDLNASFSVKC